MSSDRRSENDFFESYKPVDENQYARIDNDRNLRLVACASCIPYHNSRYKPCTTLSVELV